MTKGTGAPRKAADLSSSAMRMPSSIPAAYRPIITSAAQSGKNAALNTA